MLSVHIRLGVAGTAAMLMALLHTPAVQAQTPSAAASAPVAPITVTSCEPLKTSQGLGLGNMTFNVGRPVYFFRVGFANAGTAPATVVRFQIDFNTERLMITDAGSYAPGVTVSHIFRDDAKNVQSSPRPGGNGPFACSVVSAQFKDGTTWTAPSLPVPTATP